MKDKWRHYAPSQRLIEKGYFKKHSDRSTCRKTAETSCSNSVLESRKIQEEKVDHNVQLDYYGLVVLFTEEIVFTGEEDGKSEVGIGQPVQSSREESSSVGSEKSSSCSSGSRNKKVRRKKDVSNGSSRKEKEEVAKAKRCDVSECAPISHDVEGYGEHRFVVIQPALSSELSPQTPHPVSGSSNKKS